MPESSRAVFVSHASQDSEAAERLCAALRAAGVEVWFDRSELRGGDAWDRQIRERIHDCRLFVALISANTESRDEGYFRREWKLAVDRSHDMSEKRAFLIPVVIDGTPERGAAVPDKFKEVQWTRLPAGQAAPEFVARIKTLLYPEPERVAVHATPTAPAERSFTEPPRPSRKAKIAGIVIGAVLLAGLAYLLLDHSRRASPSSPAVARTLHGVTEKSIAVLPFADMSERKDQEYFADGMAEEILDLLAKIPELRVIGRTSSFQFKSRGEDLRAIGAKLGVAYLVEGSVRKAGSRIRVAAQLVDSATGVQLWTDSYDRAFGDVLALQDQVAAGIARALQLAVGAGAESRRPLQSTEAYTYYLRGRAAMDRGDEASLQEAISDLQQALVLDPAFTRASEALIIANLSVLGNGSVTPKAGWPPISAAVTKTLQLDPKSVVAHAVRGLQYATYDYNWSAAADELQRALALNARDPIALYNTSWLAFDLGQHEVALRQQNMSISIDPLNPDAHQNGAIIHYLIGDLDAAERGLRASLKISPDYPGRQWYLAQVAQQRGDPKAALQEVLQDSTHTRDFGLVLAYHALGRKAESDAALARVLKSRGSASPLNVAMLYAYRGERDLAFEWLERAVDERDLVLGYKMRDEPKLEPLRGDPRYKALLRKMNLPE